MFNVNHEKGFMDGFDVNDPRNLANEVALAASAAVLAFRIDIFVRAVLSTIVSPETLALFVDTAMAIPGLDMDMTYLTPYKRTISIKFKGKEYGRATFTTMPDLTHEVSDVFL